MRTEFGFERTISTSPEDILNCQHIPGYLIPADLDRIAEGLGCYNSMAWGLKNLLASPGATVIMQGQIRQIPTLVPRRAQNGHCKFLTGNRCSIHSLSPFGCAYFDSQMDEQDGDKRSMAGIMSVFEAWLTPFHPYPGLWSLLYLRGLVAPHPKEARKSLKRALSQLQNQ